MNAEQIFQKLGGRRLSEPGKFLCPCPSHEDKSPSLAVSEGDNGKVLFKCHAGCSQEAVMAAIKDLGLDSESKPNQLPYVQKKVVQTHDYIYQNWEGIDSLKVVRKDFEDGTKTFSQFRRENNQWIPGGSKDVAPFAYSKWKDLRETVFLSEGEKCQKALEDIGLLSTCVPGGANAWRSDYAKAFKDKETIIIPDNDEPGKKFAQNAFNDISKEAKCVRIIELPLLEPKGDAYDWLAKGHTKDELLNLLNDRSISANDNAPIFKCLSDIEKQDVTWLWNQRIPLKCLTLFEGEGGIGKSFAIAGIVADLTSGRPLPFDSQRQPISVLLLALEDDPSVVLKPRYEAMKADCKKIYFYDQSFVLDANKLETLEKEIISKSAKLVVIDPVIAYFTQGADANKATDVRAFMSSLHEIAKRNDIAILLVRHWNKNTHGTASQRGSGSVDFRNASRSVLQVIKNKEDRYIALEKSNYAANAKTISFKIEDGKIAWGQEIDKSADDLLSEANYKDDSVGTREDAKDLILRILKLGPVLSKDVEDEAEQYGISKRTLHRAKQDLEIESKKIDKKWYWQLSTLPSMPTLPTSLPQKSGNLEISGNLETDYDSQIEFGEIL